MHNTHISVISQLASYPDVQKGEETPGYEAISQSNLKLYVPYHTTEFEPAQHYRGKPQKGWYVTVGSPWELLLKFHPSKW